MSGPVVEWRGFVTGPRWARFGLALRNRVWSDHDLTLVDCEDEAGILRVTTRFAVSGPPDAVDDLKRDLLNGVEGWNASS